MFTVWSAYWLTEEKKSKDVAAGLCISKWFVFVQWCKVTKCVYSTSIPLRYNFDRWQIRDLPEGIVNLLRKIVWCDSKFQNSNFNTSGPDVETVFVTGCFHQTKTCTSESEVLFPCYALYFYFTAAQRQISYFFLLHDIYVTAGVTGHFAATQETCDGLIKYDAFC